MSRHPENLKFFDSSRWSYEDLWRLQKERVDAVADNQASEALIYCEHESVITAGRRYRNENLKAGDLPVYFIERGGDFTWHGPGQLVIYPILRLNGETFGDGLHAYLRFCEEWVIRVLKAYHLDAGRFGPTGVWVRSEDSPIPRKIASIGIAVRRWITYHGIALNNTNSFEGFSQIRPCNFESSIMTSLEKEGVLISRDELVTAFQDEFLAFQAGQFGRSDVGRQQAS